MTRLKRKSFAITQDPPNQSAVPAAIDVPAPSKRQARSRASNLSTNQDKNADVLDGVQALRASPDAEAKDEKLNVQKFGVKGKQVKGEERDSIPSLVEDAESASSLSELPEIESPSDRGIKASNPEAKPAPTKKPEPTKSQFLDPEAEEDIEAGDEEIQEALSRPPPVNSSYLPLPWKGRLGYACLNTYLRFSNPPVFSSRTCRIASILENRHPLKFPNEPPHATKNRPDKEQPASVRRGQEYVESLGLANARDIVKMIRWNDKYGIKFMRLSSEMFPFASHEEYGYKLAPFASETLAEAGREAAKLGHRLTTHPGQVSLKTVCL